MWHWNPPAHPAWARPRGQPPPLPEQREPPHVPSADKGPWPRSVPAQRSSGPETMRGVRAGGPRPHTLRTATGPRPYRGESPAEPGRTFPGPLWCPLGTGCPHRGYGTPPAPPNLTLPPHRGHKPQQGSPSPRGSSSWSGRGSECAARVPPPPTPVRPCPLPTHSRTAHGGTPGRDPLRDTGQGPASPNRTAPAPHPQPGTPGPEGPPGPRRGGGPAWGSPAPGQQRRLRL